MFARKVPVTIITGFLGAGKTTLIRHVLQNAKGRKLALLINEFGDLGVDGSILKGCGDETCPDDNIIELSNGCLCCTVADDFIPAIETLLSRPQPPDHIIVETSGLALPKPLVKAFDWPAIREKLTVDGVVTVVDSAAVAAGRFADDLEKIKAQQALDPSLEHDNPLEEVFEDQLLCADLVVMNKLDLLDEAGRAQVKAEIIKTLPRAVKIIETQEGLISSDVLLGLSAAAEDDLANRPSHHDGEAEHEHDDFDTFIVSLNEINDVDAVIARLKAASEAHDILRIKGFLAVEGKQFRLLVQGVGARFTTRFDKAFGKDEARVGRLVVIGQKGVDAVAITQAIVK